MISNLPQENIRELFSVLNKESRVIIKNNYLDWLVDARRFTTLSLISPTKSLAITQDAFGFASLFQTLSPSEAGTFISSWRFQAASGDAVLMQNNLEHRQLLADGNKISPLPEGNFKLSPFNNWLFVWSPWELWGYAGGGEPFLINRSGEKLNDVAILDEFNTMALVWENRVSVFFPVYGTNATIINRPVKSLVANPNQRMLYYTDEKGLWKLEY